LKHGLGSLKVIENDTIQSGTHDCLLLLTLHRNHRPISHRFRDKRRFPSKITIVPTHVFIAPTEGVPLEIGYRRKRPKKLQWRCYPYGQKSFKI